MKLYIVYFFVLIRVINVNAQDYSFINKVITPYEKNNPIPLDTIFLEERFIILGKDILEIEYLNKESFKLWWGNNNMPPLELFYSGYNFNHLKSDIIKSQKDSIINFKELNNYFYASSKKFIKNNPKNKYLSISKPFFNCSKDWCFIIKSLFIPHTGMGRSHEMYIYIKVNDRWVLYNTITLSFT